MGAPAASAKAQKRPSLPWPVLLAFLAVLFHMLLFDRGLG
jgi:hypothetical protein